MADTFEQLLEQFSTQAESAKAANLKRYEQAMAIYDEIVSRYRPGGAFETKSLAELEKKKLRTVGQQRQELVSSGLHGTTTTAGLEKKWESEVGEPSRLRLEDVLMERLSQAQLGQAGLIERREDVYPDYGAMATLAQAAAQRGGGGGGFISMGGGTHRRFEEDFPSSGMMEAPAQAAAPTGALSAGRGGPYPMPGGGYTYSYKTYLEGLQKPKAAAAPTAGEGWKDWKIPSEYYPGGKKPQLPKKPTVGPVRQSFQDYGYTGGW